MRDGPVRRALKAVARGAFWINLWGTRGWARLRGERPWKLGGSCGRCAACCEAPSIQVGPFTWFFPMARRLFLWWQERVNGFVLVDRMVRQRVFVFRCTHFDPQTRRCDSYESRPAMCRDYPRALLWQGAPEFLPGCGYKAVHPNAEGFREALRREGITGEKLAEVEKKLKLRE